MRLERCHNGCLETLKTLKALGLFDVRVPRYTSYPTAAVFSPELVDAFQQDALGGLDWDAPVSVYIHIPFCERLCWFCACHTQGTQTLAPVEIYIETLEAELALMEAIVPKDLKMGRLHWGGGTPTILPPPLIHRLANAIRTVFTPTESFEFSVEIDPTMVDRAKIDALGAEGMTRASIGNQDFDPQVQQAIGRLQPFEVTKACVDDLHAAGISSLYPDLVYGLPHQGMAQIEDTIDKVLTFAPDRVALFGYAHVPWVTKRQKLIDEAVLPDDLARYHVATLAEARFMAAGLMPIGIDHFAGPDYTLEISHQQGRLRRNFQGYTTDECQTLIGLGASSISRFAQGNVQNASATATYNHRIAAGRLAGARGYVSTQQDQLHARAIEMLMCNFTLDLNALAAEFGAQADQLAAPQLTMAQHFAP